MTLLVGTLNGTTALEISMAVSYRTKYEFTLQPNNCTHGHLSQRNKNLGSHRNIQMFIATLYVIKTGNIPFVLQWVNG